MVACISGTELEAGVVSKMLGKLRSTIHVGDEETGPRYRWLDTLVKAREGFIVTVRAGRRRRNAS